MISTGVTGMILNEWRENRLLPPTGPPELQSKYGAVKKQPWKEARFIKKGEPCFLLSENTDSQIKYFFLCIPNRDAVFFLIPQQKNGIAFNLYIGRIACWIFHQRHKAIYIRCRLLPIINCYIFVTDSHFCSNRYVLIWAKISSTLVFGSLFIKLLIIIKLRCRRFLQKPQKTEICFTQFFYCMHRDISMLHKCELYYFCFNHPFYIQW